eukprot:s447_g33.t1
MKTMKARLRMLPILAASAADVTWVLGSGGASCDLTCVSRSGCSEDAWPKTDAEFYEISKLAGQVCESTQTGSAKYDPSTDGRYCGWKGPEEMPEDLKGFGRLVVVTEVSSMMFNGSKRWLGVQSLMVITGHGLWQVYIVGNYAQHEASHALDQKIATKHQMISDGCRMLLSN